MQTATAQVAHPRQQQQTVTARILFDSGSYRTYITEALANKLQLHRRKPEQLQLATFGNAAVHHVTAHSADLTVHFSDNTAQHITATVVPTITGSITTTPLDVHVQAALPPDIHLADHDLDSGHLRQLIFWLAMITTSTSSYQNAVNSLPASTPSTRGWVGSSPVAFCHHLQQWLPLQHRLF